MTHWAHAWVDHLAYSGWLIKDPCHYPMFSTTPCSSCPHHLLFSCLLTSSSPSPIFMSSHFLLTISYFHVLSLPPHHLLFSCPLTSSSPSPIFMSSHFLLTIFLSFLLACILRGFFLHKVERINLSCIDTMKSSSSFCVL